MSTRVRKPTAERRQEIADAVLLVIGERGLTSLSTSTLAEAVGLTTGALFRHFASLEDILRETVRLAVARIEKTFPDPSGPPLERLLQLARNRVRLLGADPGLAWLLRSQQAYLTLPADAVVELRGLVTRSQKFLLDALRQGAADGSIRSDIDPKVLIVPVTGTIHALIGMPGLHQKGSARSKQSVDAVLAALRLLLSPPVS